MGSKHQYPGVLVSRIIFSVLAVFVLLVFASLVFASPSPSSSANSQTHGMAKSDSLEAWTKISVPQETEMLSPLLADWEPNLEALELTQGRIYDDPYEGNRSDIKNVVIATDYEVQALAVFVDFYSPSYLYGSDVFSIQFDTDRSYATGYQWSAPGIGADYSLRIDYSSISGLSGVMIRQPSNNPNTFEYATIYCKTYENGIVAAIPFSLLPSYTNFRFYGFMFNPYRTDQADVIPNTGYLIYKPSVTTTTITLPPVTTSTTLPPTTTTTSSVTTATTTTTTSPVPAFADVGEGHPYFEAIQGMALAGIISGYVEQGYAEFRPDNPVWRAQFAKMICGTMGLSVNEAMVCPFTDLGPDDPHSLYPHEYVAAAALYGITQGTGPSTFAPWQNISRAQVLTMVVRAADSIMPGVLGHPPAGYLGSLPSFSGVHATNVRRAEWNGLTSGLIGFGTGWDPWASSSRAEVAQVLWELLKKGS
jgi:hypothetical protein